MLYTVWVSYTKLGLGFEENSFVNVPRDNVWKYVFWSEMVYFKRCPLLTKPDSTQPAKQTPADSLFLPLARCPLMVWAHVCVCVFEPAFETVWRHQPLNVSPWHQNALAADVRPSVTPCGKQRLVGERKVLEIMFKSSSTQTDLQKCFVWGKEYAGMYRQAITPSVSYVSLIPRYPKINIQMGIHYIIVSGTLWRGLTPLSVFWWWWHKVDPKSSMGAQLGWDLRTEKAIAYCMVIFPTHQTCDLYGRACVHL